MVFLLPFFPLPAWNLKFSYVRDPGTLFDQQQFQQARETGGKERGEMHISIQNIHKEL